MSGRALSRVSVSLLLVTVIGCSKGSATGPDSSKLRIVYIPGTTGNPYFNTILAGFQAGSRDQLAEFLTVGPATPDVAAQIPFIKDQTQKNVNAICLSPSGPDVLNQACDDARAKGIKVIMVNSDLVGNESHRDAAILPADLDKIGAAQIELLGSQIGYAGKFAILSSAANAADQNRWIAGMRTALKDPKYAKMELVDVVYGDDNPEKSLKEASGLLIKHTDLRGILAPTTVGVEQAARAVQTAGVYPGGPSAGSGGVVVTGLGNPDQMRDYIKGNIISSFAMWSPADEGYIAATLAAGLVKGTIHPQEGQTFDVRGKGTLTFGKNATVVAGPLMIFNKDNIDSFHF